MTKKRTKQNAKETKAEAGAGPVQGSDATRAIQDLFRGALKGDGTISGRSALGAHFRAVTAGLKAGKIGEDVLSRLIGMDLLLLKVLEAEIIGNPSTVIQDGRLSPAIAVDLRDIRASLRQSLKDYELIRARAKGGSGEKGRRGRKNLEKIFTGNDE